MLYHIDGPHYEAANCPAINVNALTGNVAVVCIPFRSRLVSVEYIPTKDVAVEKAETGRKFNLYAGDTVVATLTVGAAQAGERMAFTLILAPEAIEVELAENQTLLIEAEKVGAGMALPAGLLRVSYSAR